MTKQAKGRLEIERLHDIADLKSLIKVGQTVYTNLRQVSSNRMTRHIKVFIVRGEDILDITYKVGSILGYKVSEKTEALVVGGCGMDLGFHVVYSLGRCLYPEGVPCTGSSERHRTGDGRYCCQSNDHVNGSQDYTIHHLHSDGGYAFHHSWI